MALFVYTMAFVKRKFLFVIGSLKTGGAERNISLVASHLASLGHQIEIALYEPIIEFKLDHRIKIHNLNLMRFRKGLIRILAIYASVFILVWKRRPFKVVAFTRLSSQFLAATFYPRVIVRYDIYPFYMKRRRWITSILLFNFPSVKKIVAPSKELEKLLLKYFIKKEKLVTIPNPVATISESAVFRLPTQRPFFLVSGRLTAQKGVDLIIKAFLHSKAQTQVDLVIMGDGPEREKLTRLVNQEGLQSKVHFLGFVAKPFSVVIQAYALILGSYREGFPNVLVEALSLGVPVISSDCPTGPKEIVNHGVNGFLFPTGDYKALTDEMDLIIKADIYARLKENSLPSVSSFNQNEVLMAWEKLLLNN